LSQIRKRGGAVQSAPDKSNIFVIGPYECASQGENKKKKRIWKDKKGKRRKRLPARLMPKKKNGAAAQEEEKDTIPHEGKESYGRPRILREGREKPPKTPRIGPKEMTEENQSFSYRRGGEVKKQTIITLEPRKLRGGRRKYYRRG